MLGKNELEKLIKDEYFQPLIHALEKSTITNKKAILQETMREFQYLIGYHKAAKNAYLDNFAHQFMKKKYTYFFVSDADLLKNLMGLAQIYLLDEINTVTYEQGLIASIIRDLMFAYLNPFPSFNAAVMDTKTICLDTYDSRIGSDLLPELWPSVYEYLDYNNRCKFARISKSTYFFHKKRIDSPHNVLYVLGNEVPITRMEGMWAITDYKCQIDSISTSSLFNSINDANSTSKQIKKLNAFTSLFHAIEYAYYQKHDDDELDKETEGFMPTIWAVMYINNRHKLVFNEEIIHINEGRVTTSSYDRTGRKVYLMKAQITQHNFIQHTFIPLKGIALHPLSDFAEYKVFGQYDRIKTIKEQRSYCTLF